jgi:hypothetical protein
MASNAKKKTTMAKLNRERKLRERRQEKQAKKEARRQAAGDQPASPSDAATAGGPAQTGVPDEEARESFGAAPSDP